MWIEGIDCLIQTSEITHVVADTDGMCGKHFDKFGLLAFYRGGASSIIDLLETEEELASAKDWFLRLVTGEVIPKDWDRGRVDLEAREEIRELLERRSKPFPWGDDYEAYHSAFDHAVETDKDVVGFYIRVFADKNLGQEPDVALHEFKLIAWEYGKPAEGKTAREHDRDRLIRMFHEATGVEYPGEVDAGGEARC